MNRQDTHKINIETIVADLEEQDLIRATIKVTLSKWLQNFRFVSIKISKCVFINQIKVNYVQLYIIFLSNYFLQNTASLLTHIWAHLRTSLLIDFILSIFDIDKIVKLINSSDKHLMVKDNVYSNLILFLKSLYF